MLPSGPSGLKRPCSAGLEAVHGTAKAYEGRVSLVFGEGREFVNESQHRHGRRTQRLVVGVDRAFDIGERDDLGEYPAGALFEALRIVRAGRSLESFCKKIESRKDLGEDVYKRQFLQ